MLEEQYIHMLNEAIEKHKKAHADLESYTSYFIPVKEHLDELTKKCEISRNMLREVCGVVHRLMGEQT